MGDEYEFEKVVQKQEIAAKKEMIKEVHNQDFVGSKAKYKEKFEVFSFLRPDEDSTYRFLFTEDPYEIAKSEKLKQKAIEDEKIRYGTFRPSGA